MREKIRFEANQTQFVTLDTPPTPTTGITGEQWQYFLADEKIMWVDPAVHQQIQALDSREIAITRNTVTRNGKKATTWTVEPVDEEPIPEEHATAAPPPPPPTRKAPAPAPAPAAARTRPAPITDADADALVSALTSAIAACALAQTQAHAIGLTIQFDAADVRALASGLMIERRDNERASRRAA
jgi:hypothetical protein